MAAPAAAEVAAAPASAGVGAGGEAVASPGGDAVAAAPGTTPAPTAAGAAAPTAAAGGKKAHAVDIPSACKKDIKAMKVWRRCVAGLQRCHAVVSWLGWLPLPSCVCLSPPSLQLTTHPRAWWCCAVLCCAVPCCPVLPCCAVQVMAYDGVRMNTRHVAAAWKAGITTSISHPTGHQLVAGLSVAFHTHGTTVHDALIHPHSALHVNVGECVRV